MTGQIRNIYTDGSFATKNPTRHQEDSDLKTGRYEMPQPYRIDSSLKPDFTPSEFRSLVDSLADAASFVRRRLLVISFTFLVTLGIAILYLIAAVPKFTAEADLALESKESARDSESLSTVVESQMGILKSENIALAVIQKLDLAKNPEFVEQNSVVRDVIRSIEQSLGWRKPETKASAMRYVLDSFQRKLSIKRRGLTYIVEMSFESVDPERAARIVNSIAETYIEQQLDAKYRSSLGDETWVKDRLNELRNQASAAQKALEDDRKIKKDMADSGVGADATQPRLTAPLGGEYRDLVAAAELSTSAYDNFRHALRQMEATRQQYLPEVNAGLISAALIPLKATSPKPGIVLGISTVGGLLLGIAIGMLRDLSRRGSGQAGLR
jgi:uncharacterized protein involved in exopolysaccharide biosynthesis